jgi:hypothetical protein
MTVEARYVPVMHSLCRLSARGVSHVVIDATDPQNDSNLPILLNEVCIVHHSKGEPPMSETGQYLPTSDVCVTSVHLARVASAPAGICSPITGKRRTSVM